MGTLLPRILVHFKAAGVQAGRSPVPNMLDTTNAVRLPDFYVASRKM
jgi:hypothetical protein